MITKTEKTVAAVFAVLVALALIAFFTVEPAYGQKPSSPPGQGECGHGNSQKPCKEDPQPDRGKDCEEHGNQGGVNEDHCAGTPTTPEETEPEETTPEETTPTTTEEEPSNPSAPEETVDTVIRPPVSLVPPRTPGAVPPSILVPDDQSVTATFEAEIQGELEKQAKSNGAGTSTSGAANPTAAPAPDALPHTGLPLLAVVGLGGALSAAGLYLRRRFPR